MKTILSHGPFQNMSEAERTANDLVDAVQGITLWSVVELYGPNHDRPAPDGSGDTWGELWVIPGDADEQQFATERGAERATVLTSEGYENGDTDG